MRNLIENKEFGSGFQIYGCSDIYNSNLKIIKERYPFLRIFNDPSELIDSHDVDVLVVASDVTLHYSQARRAILNGKHVLLDKIVSTTSKDAEELVELSEAKNKVLMVVSPLEYSPAGIKIYEIIKNKQLGKLYYITSSRMNLGIYRQDINVIWDLACHDISIQNWWMGEMPVHVWANGSSNTHNSICDTAFISMEYPSGQIANIGVSWLSPTKIRQIIISGSTKMLVFDDTEGSEKIKIYDKGADILNPESYDEFQLTYRSGDILSPRIDTYEPLKNLVSEFIESIKNGKNARTDGVKGVKIVKVLEAIDESLQHSGKMMEVK